MYTAEVPITDRMHERIPGRLERVLFTGKLLRLMSRAVFRLAISTPGNMVVLVGSGNETLKERDQRVTQEIDDDMQTRLAKYILTHEIGTIEYRTEVADGLAEIKDQRGLPQSALLEDM